MAYHMQNLVFTIILRNTSKVKNMTYVKYVSSVLPHKIPGQPAMETAQVPLIRDAYFIDSHPFKKEVQFP